MLAKRIIPCLDVKEGRVVKGVQFTGHHDVGDVLELARLYSEQGADELVFYDITASCEARVVDSRWVERVARVIDIPFCVAGGLRTVEQARQVLNSGADKIAINSPALENPCLIGDLAREFGAQCVVVGIDSYEQDGDYQVRQYTGDARKTVTTPWRTLEWAEVVQRLGAGEIVLNCINRDGVRQGYDQEQLAQLRKVLTIPLIASGGAGKLEHFRDAFINADADGALAASVFHSGAIAIPALKAYLREQGIEVRR